MTGNIAIDVAIGLVFVYCLYSLLTTCIAEFIALIFQLRAKNLKRAIFRMLDDGKESVLAQSFYDTPLIKYMSSGRNSWFFNINSIPSNIPTDIFAKGLIYVLKEEGKENKSAEKIKEFIKKLPGTETKNYLLFLFNEANEDIEKFTKSIEQWFDAMGERSIGWYKKNLSFITLGIGLVLATIWNIDSFQIVGALSKDEKARAEYVQMAGQLLQNPELTKPLPKVDTALNNKILKDSAILKRLGYDTIALQKLADDSVYMQISQTQRELVSRMDTLYKLSEKSRSILSFKRYTCTPWFYNSWTNFLGCVVTAIALSLGAPFWFDLLNKLMRLKSSVSVKTTESNPDKTKKEETVNPVG